MLLNSLFDIIFLDKHPGFKTAFTASTDSIKKVDERLEKIKLYKKLQKL